MYLHIFLLRIIISEEFIKKECIVLDSAVSCFVFFFLTFQVFSLKAYEKQKQTQKSTTQLESKSGEREKVEKFKTTENSIVSKPINPFMFGNY